MRPWSEVVDRISVLLAEGRDTAFHRGDSAKSRRLVDDAYWAEFEASELEIAIRKYLGYARQGELERQFRELATSVKEVAAKRPGASDLVDRGDRLIADLVAVTRELDALGVTDRSKIDSVAGPASALIRAWRGPRAIRVCCCRRSIAGSAA